MKLKSFIQLKTGSKFILLEDFKNKGSFYVNSANRDPEYEMLPQGLVLSVVNVRLNQCTQTVQFKVIRDKNIVKEVYEPLRIDERYYLPRNGSTEYVTIIVKNKMLDEFFNNIRAKSFTDRYNEITKVSQNKIK